MKTNSFDPETIFAHIKVFSTSNESINKTISHVSLAQTLQTQDPSGSAIRQFLQRWWLQILHWLEKTVSRLRGSWHLPQLCWLYFPLPSLAPFLFTSSNSVFMLLRNRNASNEQEELLMINFLRGLYLQLLFVFWITFDHT